MNDTTAMSFVETGLGAMNLDTLLEMRDTWRTDAKRLYDLAGHAEQEIVRRMQEMGARGLNTLERRGGDVAIIIREATITQEGLPKLQVKRLTEVG